MRKILNKNWKKCLLIFIIVFFVTFISAGGIVHHFDDAVESNNIYPDIIVIKDKFNNGEYIVIDINNKTYNIDNNDAKIFNKIEIGQKYRVIIEEPIQDTNHAYILQVHNDTS